MLQKQRCLGSYTEPYIVGCDRVCQNIHRKNIKNTQSSIVAFIQGDEGVESTRDFLNFEQEINVILIP
jgi:hypothetical protein